MRGGESIDGHGESGAVEVVGRGECGGSTNLDDLIGVGGFFEKGEGRPGFLLAGEWCGWIGGVENG